eukprot:CAMPEP_0170534944 /NCGR_PEP_ID=MMETSP0209-20121228/96438_1 /TAXON_ID=665100 ORGANISM="Litonotus pictus, Strain P1" /NCGR_SAMPLE_ID=MMETSP0209 /ASSEMBLY_ACC=CAM_ASM_000301 /LENGTH=150 /DNA_ID=CAMNT_0010835221 /DNA_START=48 /DNA_END=496 /DNA_ORIENTATION=+
METIRESPVKYDHLGSEPMRSTKNKKKTDTSNQFYRNIVKNSMLSKKSLYNEGLNSEPMIENGDKNVNKAASPKNFDENLNSNNTNFSVEITENAKYRDENKFISEALSEKRQAKDPAVNRPSKSSKDNNLDSNQCKEQINNIVIIDNDS